MSKTDPSSSNAAGGNWPGRAEGDAGRQDTTLAEQPEPATRPTRDVDDSWALSGAMAVPNVPGITTSLSASEHDGIPAPPMIPAAAPSGQSSGSSAAASVVARAAALRALGAKTMPGLAPAPINRAQKLNAAVAAAARQVAAETAAANAAVADLEEEPTHFTRSPSAAAASSGPSAASAASAAVAELVAEAPTHHAPATKSAKAAAQAPLYLDDPPDMLRLSTGTSDISVPEIDPGMSATMAPNQGDGDGDGEPDAGYSSDSAPYPAESSQPFSHDDDEASASGEDDGSGDHDAAPDEEEHDGHDDTRDDSPYHSGGDGGDGGYDYGHAAPEAMPPAAQLVAPTTAALRAAYGEDGAPRPNTSDWFEPSGGHAQQIADAGPYGHTSQQHDFSFTEPSRRRNSPPGPNRWIAPVAVVVALAAVVFAGGYFYTRSSSKAATQTAQGGQGGQTAQPGGAGESGAAAGDPGGSGTTNTVAVDATAAAGSDADNAAAPSSTVAAGLVDVRFDSKPAGAMVMLVDRGRGVTSPVGTTPVRAALEPKGTYDAIFTLEGHPTKVISLAGPKSARVVADLTGAGGEQVAIVPVPNSGTPGTGSDPAAGVTGDKGDGKTEPVATPDKPDGGDKRDSKTSRKDKDKRNKGRNGNSAAGNSTAGTAAGDEGDEEPEIKPAADGSMGSLSISAKPACDISIDGKPIGRSTPIKELPLSVGIHKITFTNKSIGVNETIAVRVTANKETKVAQDYSGTP